MTSGRAAVAVTYAPEAMSRVEAARHVGVSPTSFDLLVETGEMPPARKFRHIKRLVWLKHELEDYLRDLPIDGEVDEPGKGTGYEGVDL